MKIAIIGGGIVGLSIGYKLQLIKGNKVTVFEKEQEVGLHQSGRNSGVLHCGLAYKPGSLKAKLAVNGIKQMIYFCKKNNINHEICGKIVVAQNEIEIKNLDNVFKRGKKNGLNGLKFLSNSELKIREPYVSAKKSLLVPEEGIVDYKGVMKCLEKQIKEYGGSIKLSSNIKKIQNRINKIHINNVDDEFDLLINCSGLQADITFKNLTKEKRPLKIVPFRGEYYKLTESAKKLVNHLIYPVGNPKFPFLGVHFTKMINGDREVGPNAVLSLKREGYSNTDISISEMYDYITYPGFLKFIGKNFLFCMNEFSTSLLKSSFLNKAKILIPELRIEDVYSGPAGVRAQAIKNNGELHMDFEVIRKNNQIHLLNTPSPAATASLSIADYIIENYIT
tara:strand:- start:729 stop:1907 length:1179 start_codon:yes stop_codon:yes gene_type:complete